MAKDNVFSTPRPDKKLTPAEMLESLIQRKNEQARNRKSLEEMRKNQKSTPDFESTLESANIETAKNIKTTRMLEAMAYHHGQQNLALQKMGIRPRVMKDALEHLTNKFIGEMVVECYWLEDSIKYHQDETSGEYDAIPSITDNIGNVLGYLEESFRHAKIGKDRYSPLLENVMKVIQETAEDATDRICDECDCNDDTYEGEFNLTEEEEDEYERKLSELGRDEIVDLIKEKVMKIVQDEKKEGEARSKIFDDIDKTISDDDDSEDTDDDSDNEPDDTDTSDDNNDSSSDDNDDEEDTDDDDDDSSDNDDDTSENSDEEETKEATNFVDYTKLVPVAEGTNWEIYQTWFNDNVGGASEKIKVANKLYSIGEYKDAKKYYEEAKKTFVETEKKINSVPDSFSSNIISYFITSWQALGLLGRAFLAMNPIRSILIDTFGKDEFEIVSNKDFGNYVTDSLKLKDYEVNKFNEKIYTQRPNFTWNSFKSSMLHQCKEIIHFCDIRIDQCNNPKSIPTYEIVQYDLRFGRYTPNEARVAKLLENNNEVIFIHDPTWSEFKAFVSLNCKEAARWIGIARGTAIENCTARCNNFCKALGFIKILEDKLSNVPEGMPADVKAFTMASMNLVFATIPSDEIIISRFGTSLGSPDMKSAAPAIDWETVSWTDLFVNIKTNFAAIKNYCKEQMDCEVVTSEKVNNSNCPISGRDTIARLIATKQAQAMTQNIGNSLFEAIMVGQLKLCQKIAMETSNIDENDADSVENAALIETLLYYTIFETLNTVGMYKFNTQDMSKIKRKFMFPTMEAQEEKGVKGINSNKKLMSLGKGKNGLKKVRINTRRLQKKAKLKANSDILKGKH